MRTSAGIIVALILQAVVPVGASPNAYLPTGGAQVSVQEDVNWDDSFFLTGSAGPGLEVFAMTSDQNGHIYSAQTAADFNKNQVAEWDGAKWSLLPGAFSGEFYGSIHALAYVGSDLYAGGTFNKVGGVQATNIARWDGSTWSPLPPGLDAGIDVNKLATNGSDLFVAEVLNSHNLSVVAKWDGTTWTKLGETDSFVEGLAANETELYAGGYFKTIGETSATYVAKWDGQNWTSLAGGPDDPALAMSLIGSNLYTLSGAGQDNNRVEKWDGTTWSRFGAGLFNGYFPGGAILAVSDSEIFVGGTFTDANYLTYGRIAKWNGASWTDSGQFDGFGQFGRIEALATSGSEILAGGYFQNVNGLATSGAAEFDGTAWTPLANYAGNGVSSPVAQIAVGGPDVYVGGNFLSVGATSAFGIGKWDGSNWSRLGAGIRDFYGPGLVNAIVTSGSLVYAGGDFDYAGGNPVRNVAQWDRANWLPMASGLKQTVGSMVVAGANLYSNDGDGVKVWNGAQWTETPYQLPYMNVLAPYGNTICGAKDSVNKVFASTWEPIGDEFMTECVTDEGSYPCSGNITALATSGNNIYVAGDIMSVGDVILNGIAHWDGSNWSAFPPSFTDWGVATLTTDRYGNLYAGGTFPGHMAKWNGITWTTLGSGINGTVNAIGIQGSDVYAGGSFSAAGNKPSSNIACWHTGNFPATRHALSTNVDPPEGGSITALPYPDSDGKYPVGTQVSLIENPAPGGVIFTDWSGDVTATTNSVQITMDSDKNVTAHFFVPVRPDLTVFLVDATQHCVRGNCTLNASLTITNLGPIDSPSTNLCILGSSKPFLNSGSVQLKCVRTGTVRAGRSIQKRLTIKLQHALIGPYVIAIVDNAGAIDESNENNNQSWFGPLH